MPSIPTASALATIGSSAERRLLEGEGGGENSHAVVLGARGARDIVDTNNVAHKAVDIRTVDTMTTPEAGLENMPSRHLDMVDSATGLSVETKRHLTE